MEIIFVVAIGFGVIFDWPLFTISCMVLHFLLVFGVVLNLAILVYQIKSDRDSDTFRFNVWNVSYLEVLFEMVVIPILFAMIIFILFNPAIKDGDFNTPLITYIDGRVVMIFIVSILLNYSHQIYYVLKSLRKRNV